MPKLFSLYEIETMETKARAVAGLSFLLALVPAIYFIWIVALGSVGGEKPASVLPGTSEPLRLAYTGVAGIDQQLVTLFQAFWPVVDGTAPSLSLFSVFFFGEITGVWALLLLEGIRSGNRGRAFSLYDTHQVMNERGRRHLHHT